MALFRPAALAACVGIVLVGGRAWGEEAQARIKVRAGQPRHGYRVAQPDFPALPGFYMLRMENVQKELELAPEQIEKLKTLGREYYDDLRADREAWKDWQQMTPEERSAKAAEQREKYRKRTDTLRDQVEEVLLPGQLESLREISFRAAGPGALANPRTLEELGVTEEQRGQLDQIRQEMFEQLQEIQKKAFARSLEVLTPEQREKLRERVQKRPY